MKLVTGFKVIKRARELLIFINSKAMQKIVFFVEKSSKISLSNSIDTRYLKFLLPSKIGMLLMNRFAIVEDENFEILKIIEVESRSRFFVWFWIFGLGFGFGLEFFDCIRFSVTIRFVGVVLLAFLFGFFDGDGLGKGHSAKQVTIVGING